jgi:hypothetical protein
MACLSVEWLSAGKDAHAEERNLRRDLMEASLNGKDRH